MSTITYAGEREFECAKTYHLFIYVLENDYN